MHTAEIFAGVILSDVFSTNYVIRMPFYKRVSYHVIKTCSQRTKPYEMSHRPQCVPYNISDVRVNRKNWHLCARTLIKPVVKITRLV